MEKFLWGNIADFQEGVEKVVKMKYFSPATFLWSLVTHSNTSNLSSCPAKQQNVSYKDSF